MMLRLLSFLGLLAVPSMAPAAPAARAPTGGWEVNFADAQCLAFRDYGSAEDPIKLVLKAPAVGGVMQVAILRKDETTAAVQLQGQVGIDDQPPSKASVVAYKPKSSELRVYMLNMPSAQFGLVREAKTMSLRAGDLDVRLALSQMAPLMKIVDECVADLRRVFNISDPETATASPLKRRARGNIGRIIKSEDYPAVALDRNQTGAVKFGLLIGEDGRVADCTIIETSGVAALDAQSCAMLKTRARFQPALGADGKPAKDAVTSRVIWKTDY